MQGLTIDFFSLQQADRYENAEETVTMVKLPLCLTKYYAMKTYPVLNELCFWTLSIVWRLKNKQN